MHPETPIPGMVDEMFDVVMDDDDDEDYVQPEWCRADEDNSSKTDDDDTWELELLEEGEPDTIDTDPALELLLGSSENGDAEGVEKALSSLVVSCSTLGEHGDSALHLASLFGHEAIITRLLAFGASASQRDSGGGTALHDACASGHLKIVEQLLEADPQTLHVVDDDGDTALHNAARGKHVAIVKLLLDQGAKADLGIVNLDGETPRQTTDDPAIHQLLSSSQN